VYIIIIEDIHVSANITTEVERRCYEKS